MLTHGLLTMLLSQVFISVKAPTGTHINSHTKFQLGFSKFQFFNGQNGQEVELHHYAKFCRNHFNRGRNMAIFKMADAAMLDKILKFFGRKGQEGRNASVCQMSSKSLELRPR